MSSVLNREKVVSNLRIRIPKDSTFITNKTRRLAGDITNKDRKYISSALDIAQNSNMLMKHGCVVVENNRIVGKGWNMMRNQFKENFTGVSGNFIGVSCSCHAEMYALRQALRTKTKGKSSPFRKRPRSPSRWEKEA